MARRNIYNRAQKASISLSVRIVGFVLCLLLLGLITYYMWREYNDPHEVYHTETTDQPEESGPESQPETESEAAVYYYPPGTLIDTPERKAYVDGDMTLYIPRIQFEGPVLDGVTNDVLEKGVGLFDQAQLPGPMSNNSNVSIAGNREETGKEFYEIDKLEIGDQIILTYQENTYVYVVEETFVTGSEDWEPIKVREFSCVTLQSRTPIGSGVDRIFVVGRLDKIVSGGMDEESPGEERPQEPSEPGTVRLPSGESIQLDSDQPIQI